MPEERFLSTEEVAERLQVDEQTVRRWIKSGKLEAFKPGREWRISPAALEALLESYSSPKGLAPLPFEDSEQRRIAEEEELDELPLEELNALYRTQEQRLDAVARAIARKGLIVGGREAELSARQRERREAAQRAQSRASNEEVG